MISRFFIDRPIFATVLSVIITLTGGIALLYLPLAQYPRITPPGVSISISYPGASAQEVADTVGAPIEQQVTGVDGMLYMSSQSGNDGSYSLTVTFDINVDLKTALVMVQNRVALAMPQLPSSVQNQGITIRKRTPDMLMIVNFYSPDKRYDDLFLSNYATIYCKDELLRVDGISDVLVQGQRDYSMRIWLDPQKMASRNISAVDVATAIQNQNVDAPAGRIGHPPITGNQMFELPLDTIGRLTSTEQFGDIIVKVGGKPAILSPTGMLPQPAMTASSGGKTGVGPAVSTAPAPTASAASQSNNAVDNASGSLNPPLSSTTPNSTTINPPSLLDSITGSSYGDATVTPDTGSNSTTSSASGTVGSLSLSGGMMSSGMPNPARSIVRVRDIGRVELGAQNYNTLCSFDGQASVGLGLYQLPGTNALEVADRVRAKMEELKARFPEGLDYAIGYDTTPFIRDSVNDVIRTLLESVGLVAIVVLVFLQSWRASIIPLVAVPVAIIGTFAVMAGLGYSLNNISLFGLVLAIGIVVDDAIVVVENVERWMDLGESPKEATRKAMDEVTGPIIAVALVLSAVFVPCAFLSGITGQFFRQFAVTISVSTIFSAFNSLTLSPALAAILLRPRGSRRDPLSWLLHISLGWFFWLFNKSFGLTTSVYAWTVGWMIRLSMVVLLVYAGMIVLTGREFQNAPTGFIPQQDQGRLIVNVQLPDSASLERTQNIVLKVEEIARKTPGVAHTVTNAGMSFLLQANSPNFASMFVVLKPFSERQAPGLRDVDIMKKLRAQWAADEETRDALVTVFGAAPVPGLGQTGGFTFLVEDRAGMGVKALQDQLDNLVRNLAKAPGLKTATTQFRSNTPQIFLDIDRAKAAALGVSLDDVNQTLDMFLGSLYVNSYNEFGRHWQVTVQAEPEYRSKVENINLFQVRNNTGQMVPLGTLVKPKDVGGPISITRYNLYPAAPVNGNIDAGSSGDAVKDIEKMANDLLPLTMRVEWTTLMFMQIRAGNKAIYIFILAVISVFLALSALYESWSLPLAVIMVVPLCLLCSVEGVINSWRFDGIDRDVNIFVQIGLVVLVGLACKNAILIVEFSRQLSDEGRSTYDATVEASRLRLRPILMTSFAFIFGVIPLVVASGAGSEMRRSLGIAVFSGMLGVTIFGIFLTPVFFYIIHEWSASRIFGGKRTRSILSYTFGMILGSIVGFSISHLGALNLFWTTAIGGTLGLLAVRAIRNIRRSSLDPTISISPPSPPTEMETTSPTPITEGDGKTC